MKPTGFLEIAEDLEIAGLVWQPEIGDEVIERATWEMVSVLVDPEGMSPRELRNTYLWLPSVEQMVTQLEVRQAILFHVGLELTDTSLCYKAVVHARVGPIQSAASNVRSALGLALRELLLVAEDKLN